MNFFTQRGRALLLSAAVMLAAGAWAGTQAWTWDEPVDPPEPTLVTVTWNANGGTPVPAVEEVEVGGTVIAPSITMTKNGYGFDGWYVSTTATTPVTFPATVTKDTTFYAKWNTVNYNITYDLDGGTLGTSTNPASYTIETATITLNNPTKSGYTFAGWTGSNGTVKQTSVSIAVGSTGHKEYTANWTLNIYTITFNVNYNGGTNPPNATTGAGWKLTSSLPTPAERTGYTFNDWYKSPTNTADSMKVTVNTVYTANTIIYARWTPITYNIVYELIGGVNNAQNPLTYTIENTPITLRDPTKTSSDVFGGWYDNASFTGTAVTSILANSIGDRKYFAKWETKTYTITFNANQGTPATVTRTTGNDGKVATFPADPTRTGYTFAGWFTAALDGDNVTTAMPFGADRTVYAHWTLNVYTIKFNVNGNATASVSPDSLKTNNAWKLDSLPTPKYPGYTFRGWTRASNGTGAFLTKDTVYSANATIYAQWTIIPYTVTFNANYTGGTITPASAVTGAGGRLTSLPQPTRDGYTFDGWSKSATSNAAAMKVTESRVYSSDTTIWAQWTLKQYTVTFNVSANSGSATVSPATLKTNSAWKLDSLPTPVRNSTTGDYVFRGWYRSSSDTSAAMKVGLDRVYGADTTIWAQWTLKTYKIKFDAQGGTPAMDSVMTSGSTSSVGRVTALPTQPTRSGYDFAGWFRGVTAGTLVTDTTVFKKDTTVYARWTASTSPSVTFNPNGGTVTPTFAAIGADGKIAALPTPTRKGYTFKGWYTVQAANGGDSVALARTYSEATIIYARWALNTYTVTFNVNYTGGTITPATAVTGNTAATAFKLATLPAPTRSGYTLSGWYTAAAGGDPITTSTEFYANDTIFARWALVTYTVTFNVNSGSGTVSPASAVTGEGQKLATLPTASRNGYSFVGWYDTRDTTGGNQITTATVFSANTTIYARWAAGLYKIKFNANGGTVTPDSGMTGSDRRLASIPTPTRGGYTFNGWFTTATAGSVVTGGATGTVFSANDTIYAHWTLITYTIKFNANGGTVTPASAATGTGQKLVTLPTAVRTGYTLSGWFTTAADTGGTQVTTATVFSDSATIYARWELGTYTIKFNAGGGTVTPDSAKTGTDRKLASLPTPTRTGYTFNGWFTAASGGSAVTADRVYSANATIYAQWTIVSYKITFNAGGGTVSPDSAKTGAGWKLTTLPTPKRESYIFNGWYTTADTGGKQVTTATAFTDNATVYARWAQIGADTTAVIFDANGGSVTPAYGIVGANGKLKSLPNPTARDGYVFEGWFTAVSGGTKVTVDTVFSESKTIYAVWTAIAVTNITGVPQELAINELYALSGTVVPANVANNTIVWSVKDAGATGAKIVSGVFFASDSGRVVVKAVIAKGKADGTDYEQEFTIRVVPFVSVASPARVIPPATGKNAETAVVTPVSPITNGITAGPNVALKSLGAVSLFRQGSRVKSASLSVYNALGKSVGKIAVSDKAAGVNGKRVVGTWNLKDTHGRPVGEGTYVVKGVIKTADGKRERVSAVVTVR